MVICDKNKCTACGACLNACKRDCIEMREDEFGEMHPHINNNACAECGLCVNVCPNNISLNFQYPSKCFASWIVDDKKRAKCATGGVGTLLSEYVILKKNGVVFATSYDDNLVPKITVASTLSQLESKKGSKYVQSIIDKTTFVEVQKYLRDNVFVLFIGTPCQVAGLKGFLRTEYDNLLTVDLICHGVCPTKYFVEELDYLCNKNSITKKNVSDIRFRGNDVVVENPGLLDYLRNIPFDNNYVFSIWEKIGDKECRIYAARDDKNEYLAGFFSGATLRKNCFSCNYAKPERISDITIGDYIGLGKMKPYNHSMRNVSCVLTNTLKGEKIYMEVCRNKCEIYNEERDYSERLLYKPSLLIPSVLPSEFSKFRSFYRKEGFVIACNRVFSRSMRKKRIINFVRILKNIPFFLYRNIK